MSLLRNQQRQESGRRLCFRGKSSSLKVRNFQMIIPYNKNNKKDERWSLCFLINEWMEIMHYTHLLSSGRSFFVATDIFTLLHQPWLYTTQRLRLTKGSTLIYDKDGHFHCPSRSSSRTGQSRGLCFYPLHLLANTTDSPCRPCIAS